MNKIRLDFEIKGKISIEVNESVLKVIAEEYQGDHEEYFRYFPIVSDNIQWDLEEKEYETKVLEEALETYRKNNGFEENFQLSKCLKIKKNLNKYLHMNSFEEFKKYNQDIIIEEFVFDKVELEHVSSYADENNPTSEFNYIYFDKENIVSTNTRVLVCNKNNTNYKDIYIPKLFCDALCAFQDAQIFIEYETQTTYLVLDEKIYKDEFKNLRFIDYKKIIPTKFNLSMDTVDMIGTSRTLLLNEDEGIRAFAYRLTDRFSVSANKKLDDKYLCASTNINFGLECVGIVDYNLPFVLFTKDKQKLLVVMPLIFSDEEIEKYLKN